MGSQPSVRQSTYEVPPGPPTKIGIAVELIRVHFSAVASASLDLIQQGIDPGFLRCDPDLSWALICRSILSHGGACSIALHAIALSAWKTIPKQ